MSHACAIKGKGANKGKGKKGKGKGQKPNFIIEHHGVMFIYHKDLEKSRIWFKQISGRLLQICFKTKGPNLVITNTLASHTWKSGDRSREDMLEIMQDFFQRYTEILLEHKDNCLHVAVGDFNTRLHGQMAGEESVLGKYVWGRGVKFLKTLDQPFKEQRALLVTTLKATNHVHMNSFFEKCDEKKVTRSDWSAEGPPFSPQRYAELDAIIANHRCRNMVKNVESNSQTDFPSDRFPVEARLKLKLAKHRGRPPDKSNEWKNPIKPNEENQNKFNNDFKNHYQNWTFNNESSNKEELDQKINAFQYAIIEAAKENIEKKPTKAQEAKRSPEL